MDSWRKISSETIFENNWLRLRVDRVTKPTGDQGTYSLIDKDEGVVIIVPIDAQDNIYMVKINRYPTGQTSWEVPKGSVEQESPESAAKRELKEETGLESKKLTNLGQVHPLNGLSSEINYIFLAQGLSNSSLSQADEEGIFEIKAFPIARVTEMIRSGEITDGQSISAIFKAILRIGEASTADQSS